MLTVHNKLEQRTEAWYAARRGIVTASMVGQFLSVGAPDAMTAVCPSCGAGVGAPCLSAIRKTPTPIKTIHDARTAAVADAPPVISLARNDSLTALLAAERITDWSEPTWMNADMERGVMDEPLARDLYAKHCTDQPVTEAGLMILEDQGFRIGFSPDGLVGDDGLIEVKSRRQKKQLMTVLAGEVPGENVAQIQCGLLVSGRQWCDYISYSGGMHLWVMRVYPDPDWFAAITAAAVAFEKNAEQMVSDYLTKVDGLPMTERDYLEVI